MGKVAEAPDRPPGLAWLIVFLANLPIPLMLGWIFTEKQGRIGMALAIVLWWLMGHLVCRLSRGFDLALVTGGMLVGLTQFFPFLHLKAGAWSLFVGSKLGQVAAFPLGHDSPGDFTVLTELGGFIATTLTGGILIAVALACGAVLRAITPGPSRTHPKPGWHGES